MILQHVLVFFLIVVTPLWDWCEIPRLKASTDPGKKVRFYGKIAVASWICAVLAALTVGAMTVFTIPRTPGEGAWLAPGSLAGLFLAGLTAGLLIVIMLPAVLALWSEKIRTKAGRAAKKLAALTVGAMTVFTIPRTPGEGAWLAPGSLAGLFLAGLTAGLLIVIMLPAVLALWSEKI